MTDTAPARTRALADAVLRAAFTAAYQIARLWWFVRRPQHDGAYVAVWQGEELLLIRNSYKPGDTVPCGGIGRGESPLQAARENTL